MRCAQPKGAENQENFQGISCKNGFQKQYPLDRIFPSKFPQQISQQISQDIFPANFLGNFPADFQECIRVNQNCVSSKNQIPKIIGISHRFSSFIYPKFLGKSGQINSKPLGVQECTRVNQNWVSSKNQNPKTIGISHRFSSFIYPKISG